MINIIKMYKKLKTKKSMAIGFGTMFALVLGLIVLILVSNYIIWPAIKKMVNVADNQFDETDYETCKLQGQRETRNIDYNDIDNDMFPDSCDICVCKDGCNNINDDKDKDKLPTKCDKDDNDFDNLKWSEGCKDYVANRIKQKKSKRCIIKT